MKVSGGSKPIYGLAMGVVGAIAGMFVGNPMMGFKLGMLAGSFLFVPKAESQVNRVAPSDVQIPTCETGNPIPAFYGTFGPMSGNVVYFGNKTRITHTEETEVGGKGGGARTTNIWYTWEVDFAICIGWGPGTILRAYAGGKEINLDKFRILDGTQATYDAIFASKIRRPVYKGLILVVAESYSLGESGQFPLFQFEVARKFPIDALGTHQWTTTTPITVAGGIDSLDDVAYLGGGSSTTLPQIDIYDGWIKRDDTVPGTIPAAVKRIAVADNFAFLVEWTTNPLKVYKYTRATMAYVSTLDLTGTANKIFAVSCDGYRLFICYNNVSNAVRIAEYKTSTMALENTRTITGITAGQEITAMAVNDLYFYLTDTVNAKVWQIPRASLAATSRTIASGTPNGVDTDNDGNIWVANNGTSVYRYSPAWALLSTITLAAFGNASGVAIMPRMHKLAVLAKTGDVGTVVCVSTGGLTTTVNLDFEYERTWKIATSTDDVAELAATSNMVAVLESPSSDIFLFGPTGYYRNTITGTFLDIDVNELGLYAVANGSNDVQFYAGGEGAANTRTVSTDVAGDGLFYYTAECTFGDVKLVAVGKDAPGGSNTMFVFWNNSYAGRWIDYFCSYYTLPSNGNVSTATYLGTFPVYPETGLTPATLRASKLGYGVAYRASNGSVYGWNNQTGSFQKLIKGSDALTGFDWVNDCDRLIACTAGAVNIYSKDGVRQKHHVDAGRYTALKRASYYDGRIYVVDKVSGAGNTRILSYITDASPLSTVGEVLPAELGYDFLTNTKYGARIDPSVIDKDASRRANSYCFKHGLFVMPMYNGQMTAADLLEDLCTHHNGFISITSGKISHRQYIYDPFDDDCAFTEIAGKSDAFGDGSIGAQWIPGPNTADQVEASGYLTLSPEASETAYIAGAALTYGAFDLQVDYAAYAVTSGGASAWGKALLQFYIDATNYAYIGREKSSTLNRYTFGVVIAGTPQSTTVTTTDASGKFRLVREGQTITGYYHNGTTWVLIASYGSNSALGGVPRLFASSDAGCTTTAQLDNYKHYESYDAIYPEHIIEDITDAEGKSTPKEDVVAIVNTGNRDRVNQVNVEYSRRSLSTGPAGPAKASDFVDIAENQINSVTLRLGGLRRLSSATFMAYLYLKKALAINEQLTFELGWKNRNIKAGDLAWVTYPLKDLDHAPVRVMSLEVTPQGTHKITAMREDDIYDVDVYADDIQTAIVQPPPNVDPGDLSNIKILLMPAELSAPLDYDIDFFFTKPRNDAWAGASIYQAYAETGDYVRKGTTNGAGVQGIVVAVGDSAGTKYIDVRLDGDDTLSTIASLPSYFQNLAYVRDVSAAVDHYIQFTTVALQSLTTWRLSGLTYDTIAVPVNNSYGAIAAGDTVVFYAKRPFTLDIPDADLGVPLWFKLLSVNQAGQEQSLSEVAASTVTVASRNTIPVIGDYSEGTPAAAIGDAVHHEESTDLYYRANPFTRANVVGVKDGFGNIVTTGPARKLPSKTAGAMYYLACPTITDRNLSGDGLVDLNYQFNAGYTMFAQGFRAGAGGNVIIGATMTLRKTNTGDAPYNLCLEIRTSSGGFPTTTVLARSEWIAGKDMPPYQASTPNYITHFRFFEFVELAANTLYHMVIRPDWPEGFTPVYTESVYVCLKSASAQSDNASYHNGSYWAALPGYANADILMHIYEAETASTATPNITTTHPFSTQYWASTMGYLPIQKVGKATAASEMLVAIDRNWPVVEYQDLKTTWTTVAKHLVATLDVLGAERLLLLFHFWGGALQSGTATPYLNDSVGSNIQMASQRNPYQRPFPAQVFDKATFSDLLLSAKKYIYLSISTLGAPGCGRIIIIKESVSGVPPTVIPQEVLVPKGGTTGQVLAKATEFDNELLWTTVSSTPPDGSITGEKLAAGTAGDYQLITVAGPATTTSQTYVKLIEFRVAQSGTYRIKFGLSASYAGQQVNGQIYKNGSAVGTERSVTGTTYVDYSEDISSWAVGDLCQIYAKIPAGGGYTARVRDFGLYISAPLYPIRTV